MTDFGRFGADILEVYRAGLNNRGIAARVGCGEHLVGRVLRKAGLRPNRQGAPGGRMAQHQLDAIRLAHEEGLWAAAIARKLRCSLRSVHAGLKALEVVPNRPPAEIYREAARKRLAARVPTVVVADGLSVAPDVPAVPARPIPLFSQPVVSPRVEAAAGIVMARFAALECQRMARGGV